MKRLLTIAVLILLVSAVTYGQGELNEQSRVYYRNERTFSLALNSDGFGGGYREGKWIDPRKKTLYEIDFNFLKHPKEVKLSNPWYQTTGTFVFGKLNSVATIRGGMGIQREIFPKKDLGGIAINYFVSGGVTIAAYKPIYYRVLYPIPGSGYFEIKEEKFEVSIHQPADIYSKASFTKGFDEIKVLPGAYLKGGFSFEFSRNDKVLHAVEDRKSVV